MKKFFTLAVLLLAGICSVNADDISKEQALQIAAQFMNSNGMCAPSFSKGMHSVASDLEVAESTDGHYVINNSDGFVVVASDDAVPQQILGYCTSGSFDADDIPEGMRDMLDDFDSQIVSLKENGSIARTTTATTFRDPILYTTPQWGQAAPFNLKCPKDGVKRSLTGCVATAAAEVMYYNSWPQIQDFNWSDMTYQYDNSSTEASCKAVATLMSNIGIAAGMKYSATGSGTSVSALRDALVGTFHYSSDAVRLYRCNYTPEEWEDIVYNNLREYGPMIYDGNSNSGHCFVCDGYQNGYFHFNWGWCGRCNDTYFSLCALTPGGTGDGGNATHDYSNFQSAIFNLHPDNGVEHAWKAGAASQELNKADFTIVDFVTSGTAASGGYFKVTGTMKNDSNSRLVRELIINLVDINSNKVYSSTYVTADAQSGENFHYETVLNASASPGTYMVILRYADIIKSSIMKRFKVTVTKGGNVQSVSGDRDYDTAGITETTANDQSVTIVKKVYKNGKISIIKNNRSYNPSGMEY